METPAKKDKPKVSRRKRLFRFLLRAFAIIALALLVYFPGRQAPIAFTLATGIGVDSLQDRIDMLEEKAIAKESFSDDEKRFLKNLYSCFAKGGRLIVVTRQSADLMERYLSGSGEDLKTSSRIFCESQLVKQQINIIRQEIIDTGGQQKSFRSDTFYMGDPEFFDSYVGLYDGHVQAVVEQVNANSIVVTWRAECPWEWPSYDAVYEQYGRYHARTFPLPNARSLLFGKQFSLKMDDGLGGQLVDLGLAEPFLAYSEWTEDIELPNPDQ